MGLYRRVAGQQPPFWAKTYKISRPQLARHDHDSKRQKGFSLVAKIVVI
jgi:hypothetical protein